VDENKDRIGFALSGGGIRAAIFHLGVLKYLAEKNMLGRTTRVSSVSGASLAIGMIFSNNSYKWPTDDEYIDFILPKVREIILKRDIQKHAITKLIYSPCFWNKKANLLSNIFRKQWGVTGLISDLPETPKWYINCTTYETGKRFRFSQGEMGDYTIGYIKNPVISISDAISASAGFPIFIGPYRLSTNLQWEKSHYFNEHDPHNNVNSINLWDGGIYDNLGVESVFKPDEGGSLRDNVDFIIVSNASASIKNEKHTKGFSRKKLKRLLEIVRDQNQALRSRMVIDYIKRTQKGVYLKIGRGAHYITSKSEVHNDLKKHLIDECLSCEETEKVRDYKTTLKRPSKEDFNLILRHGYEVAMCTFECYQ